MTARKKNEDEDRAPQQEWPRIVRTTFRPDEDVIVTETEYTELRVQGVLIEDKGN